LCLHLCFLLDVLLQGVGPQELLGKARILGVSADELLLDPLDSVSIQWWHRILALFAVVSLLLAIALFLIDHLLLLLVINHHSVSVELTFQLTGLPHCFLVVVSLTLPWMALRVVPTQS